MNARPSIRPSDSEKIINCGGEVNGEGTKDWKEQLKINVVAGENHQRIKVRMTGVGKCDGMIDLCTITCSCTR
jgi:hypothetical protein